MAKLIGPDFLALQVRDLESSITFYTKQLGLEPLLQSPPGAVVFNTAPIRFALRNPAVNLDEANKLGWGTALWFNCDNADELCSHLENNGTPIIQKPFDGPFGRTFSFADPDGYIITVHQA